MTETKLKKKRTLFHKIVNVFLGILIGIFLLIVLFIGFSQTKTFRELLREKIIATANSNINGKLFIEKIDGTILTSLILRNTLLTMGQDTVLSAEKIELETSPLRILLKQIHIRNFELKDAKVNLIKDSAGSYNVSHLFKPTPEDTSKSEFPFTIKISSFKLQNVNLISATEENRYSNKSYSFLNLDDFRVDSLNLTLNAFANILKNDFLLNIDFISCKTNINNVTLKNLSGKIELTDGYAKVTNLAVQTKSTDFDLDVSLEDFHPFKNFSYIKLKQSPVKLRLTTRIFNFSELSSFIPSTDLLKGVITTTVFASGKYGNMKIDKIAIDYLKTHLEGTASISDLHDPQNLFIKAHLTNSVINQSDIAQLLPEIGLPVYNDLIIKNVNLDFEGKPNNFIAKFGADFPQGNVTADVKLDFTSDKMKYDVALVTQNLDLSPIIQSRTSLNTKASVQGEGTNPKELSARLGVKLNESSFQQYFVDSLSFNGNANDGIFDYNFDALAKKLKVNLNGNIDFYDSENPVYEMYGECSNMDLKSLLKDSTLSSNINFVMELRGKGFNLDNMDSKLILNLDSSRIAHININPTEIIFNYTKPDPKTRLIKINSDLADLTINGNYLITDVTKVLGYEAEIISNQIKRKINSINPWAIFQDTTKSREFESNFLIEQSIPDIVNNKFNINYELLIRDLSKVKSVSGLKDINVDGKITGEIINDEERFELSSDIHFDRIKWISDDNIIYISNFDLGLNSGRDNRFVSSENIFGKIDLSIERVFSGTDVKNFIFNLNLDKNIIDYNISMQLDTTLKASIDGKTDFSGNELQLTSEKLYINYKNFEWKNDGEIKAYYNKDYFELEKFKLIRNGSSLDFSGKIFGNGAEEITARISNLDMDFINLLAGLESGTLSGSINLEGQLSGFLHDPIIKLQLDIDNIIAKNSKLGYLKANFFYTHEQLNTEIKFLDSNLRISNPSLTITGELPLNLALVGAPERIIKDKDISLSINSKDFDLSVLGNFIPYVKDLSGKLLANLNVGGSFDNFDLNGNLNLSNTYFTLVQNNLPYSLELDLLLKQGSVFLQGFNLRNAGKTDFKGRLFGEGNFNFNDKTAEVNVRGDLVILSLASKSSMPYFYGDLTIRTDGDWHYTYKDGTSFFNGVVLLKNMDITVPQMQTAYSTSSDYVYHYVIDTSNIDRTQDEFKEVVKLARKYSPIRVIRPQKSSNFRFNLHIKTEDEAILNLILNQEANQRLRALLKGDLIFESGGIAQGEFKLLEGSELTFIKTFTAEGKIYFERDLANPRLDIVATYRAEHLDSLKSEEVAVKIKLEGPIDKLGENLNKSSGNIAVYEGQYNIDHNLPSPDKNAADAITFILLGKFLSQVTTGDKASMSGLIDPKDYSNSALSGLMSAFANEYFGDVVRNIELEQRGSFTRLSVSGKIQKLKYSFGTKTEEFQDISKANLKLEYPFDDNFLIRFERKDPILENIANTEKINEIAIKYKFVF